ncbi:MAG TPA: alpha/beta hydrolase [Candidatus Hydrogenedentes bacterium]|nr:alpha/beta hydrolase [Candidatus Hydrogenedentota bacterium]
MAIQENFFKAKDGAELFARRWAPEGTPTAHLVLIHGYGEYCGRYDHVGKAFKDAGIDVHSYDQRGFGQSPGKRAYIHDFNVLLDDLDAFLDHVRPRFAGHRPFFMGHSMGGMVLARYVQTRRPETQGLVFSSPFLAFNDDVPAFLLALADVLGKIAPWLPVGSVDNAGLSRDPAVVAAADADPLAYHGKVHARTGAQFNAAIRAAREAFDQITEPAYIIHGGADRIVPSAGSQMLYEGCASTDKFLKIYENGYHELWNDLDKETVIAGIRDWILAHAPKNV